MACKLCDTREWTATNYRIYRGRDQVAVALAYDEAMAEFLAAAANHYRQFLGEVTGVDADIYPEQFELFAPEKTQKA